MVYLYIKRRSVLDHKPEVAADAKGALKHLSKKYDTDNRRKIQSSTDLLFLSWAQILKNRVTQGNKKNKLEEAMLHEVDGMTEADARPVLKQLYNIFQKIDKSERTTIAKTFRDNIRAHMRALVASTHTLKVSHHRRITL